MFDSKGQIPSSYHDLYKSLSVSETGDDGDKGHDDEDDEADKDYDDI